MPHQSVFTELRFYQTFTFSPEMAILTIIVSPLRIIPTAYWVHLRSRGCACGRELCTRRLWTRRSCWSLDLIEDLLVRRSR